MDDKYLTYKALDFAADEAFIDWIQKPSTERAHQWSVWLEAHPQMQDEIQGAKALLAELQVAPLEIGSSKDETWARIQTTLKGEKAASDDVTHTTQTGDARPPIGIRTILRRASWLAAASVAVFFIVRSTDFFQTKIVTTPGQQMAYVLPDESIIHINDGSKVTFRARKFDNERTVRLAGEAFFEVKPGVPFTVRSHSGRVRVLGTSFNIYDREETFAVHCKTGKVEVTAGATAVILVPGEMATLAQDGTLEKAQFDASAQIPWMAGRFTFDDQPLSRVMAEFERQFDVQVDLPPDLADMPYSGFFEEGNRQKALEAICWPLRLHAVEEGALIRLTAKPLE